MDTKETEAENINNNYKGISLNLKKETDQIKNPISSRTRYYSLDKK